MKRYWPTIRVAGLMLGGAMIGLLFSAGVGSGSREQDAKNEAVRVIIGSLCGLGFEMLLRNGKLPPDNPQ
jgi:hypothetical protein